MIALNIWLNKIFSRLKVTNSRSAPSKKQGYQYPVYQPLLNGKEQQYVDECIKSSWISSKGSFIEKFEQSFKKYIGAKYATSVANGTVALHLALLALDIKPGDEVIVPSLTYIASVNAIRYVGATPVFVDSLKDTWQIDPAAVKAKITSKTKAVMVVHLYGQSSDLKTLVHLCKQKHLYLIEDAAEAFGTYFHQRHVGTFGDVGVFSFYGNKTITTGEGGMVVTNKKALFSKIYHYKTQGLSKNREYWHDTIGYNYRMTNICAAIGLAQLQQAKRIIAQKRKIYNWYRQYLHQSIQLQAEATDTKHSFWMVSMLVFKKSERDSLRKKLAKQGIETRPLFYPIHTMPMYKKYSTKCPHAINLASRGINLPSYPALNESDIQYISNCINKYFKL